MDFAAGALWSLAEAETGLCDRAIDHLGKLLSPPSWLSAGWLRVDPVWDRCAAIPSF